MAKIVAYQAVNINTVDFNFFDEYFSSQRFENNVYETHYGTQYADFYTLKAEVGTADYFLIAAGANLTVNSSNSPTGGTVNHFEQASGSGGSLNTDWYANGVSISFAILNQAISTLSNADDKAIIAGELEGKDTIYLSAYADVFRGYGGDDLMLGYGGADKLYGDSGNDIIKGGTSADVIDGGSGDDDIYGGTGADTLTGNSGADWFIYENKSEGTDKITYFSTADFMVFKGSAFGLTSTGSPVALSSYRFQSRDNDNYAQDSTDRFIFRESDDTLWYDSNGDASGGLYKIADFYNNVALTSADILIT